MGSEDFKFILQDPPLRSKSQYKIEKYWKEHFINNKKEILLKKLDLCQNGKQEIEAIFNHKDINDILIDLVKQKHLTDVSEEELIDLYLQKQENSYKKIKLIKIKDEKKECLNNVENKIKKIYSDKDYFDKYKLCKNIESVPNNLIELIYINKVGNKYHLVFNHKVTWSETKKGINPSSKTITESTQSIIVIDPLSQIIQLRVFTHRGLNKINYDTDERTTYTTIYNELTNKLINILGITIADIEDFSIQKNINALFKESFLIKYEGTHLNNENGNLLKINFKLSGNSKAGIDYTNLNAYSALKKDKELKKEMEKSILLIKGTWDRNHKDSKGIFIPEKKEERLIIFEVGTSEITTLSSYNERELAYALSHVTKDI